MDFNLSDEQQMLADTVQRFVEQEYDFEARRKLARTDTGFSKTHWKTLAEIGLTGLLVPEEHGGMGAGPEEALIAMEALGRGLVLEPLLSTAVVAASLIARHGSGSQKSALLPAIADGSMRIALASLEPGARFDLWSVATDARRRPDGSYALNGRKCVVIQGDSAQRLIVSARTSGSPAGKDGITLFLVDAAAPGVTVKAYPNIDGHHSADILLQDATVDGGAVLGEVGRGYEPLEWATDRGIAALCAEAVGTMSRLFDITVEYLRTRKQFGQPIGRFQALQHRATEMLVAMEQARSVALMAAAKVDDPDPIERRRAVSAAKAVVGRSGRFIGEQAIQLHGGMGMTDELATGHYFKRLHCIDMTWGDSAHHRELYGEVF